MYHTRNTRTATKPHLKIRTDSLLSVTCCSTVIKFHETRCHVVAEVGHLKLTTDTTRRFSHAMPITCRWKLIGLVFDFFKIPFQLVFMKRMRGALNHNKSPIVMMETVNREPWHRHAPLNSLAHKSSASKSCCCMETEFDQAWQPMYDTVTMGRPDETVEKE